jgi:hypothetical protein
VFYPLLFRVFIHVKNFKSPAQNYTYYEKEGKKYYLPKTNTFKHITGNVLTDACQKFPKHFGTGNANDIIEAIYKIDPVIFLLKDFVHFLQNEQFCYVVEGSEKRLNEKILRIDLFREIKPNKQGRFDFVGGLFHANKHFSFKGIPLSTGTEINDISSVEYLIYKIAESFFSENMKHKKGLNYTSLIPLNEKYNLRVEFYFGKKTGVYFINTVFKEKNLSPLLAQASAQCHLVKT